MTVDCIFSYRFELSKGKVEGKYVREYAINFSKAKKAITGEEQAVLMAQMS